MERRILEYPHVQESNGCYPVKRINHKTNYQTTRSRTWSSKCTEAMGFLFFALLIVFPVSAAFQDCASGCHCTHGRDMENRVTHTVDCSSRKLSEIPNDIPHRVTRLIMAENDLSHIQEFDWSKWTNLRELSLAETCLRVVRPAFFNGLDQLEVLTLSKNNISVLDKGTFTSLRNLRHLTMTSNSLISWSSFKGLENLISLTLQKNKISHLPNGTFLGMGQLTQLVLDNNLIEELHENCFDGLKELRRLSLSRNHFST